VAFLESIEAVRVVGFSWLEIGISAAFVEPTVIKGIPGKIKLTIL